MVDNASVELSVAFARVQPQKIIAWNLYVILDTMKERASIQEKRVRSDSQMKRLICQEDSPPVLAVDYNIQDGTNLSPRRRDSNGQK